MVPVSNQLGDALKNDSPALYRPIQQHRTPQTTTKALWNYQDRWHHVSSRRPQQTNASRPGHFRTRGLGHIFVINLSSPTRRHLHRQHSKTPHIVSFLFLGYAHLTLKVLDPQFDHISISHVPQLICSILSRFFFSFS